jgi:rare lipoprotein A (peptidoglycan hydrolase)
LINNVPVGTIVKITNQGTGKSVYAKVLGQLPDMKESAGLTLRLSNAAAAELGVGDGRFSVGVSY